MAKGLIIVHTGNGKGKTTAALGLAFRALGHGFPVGIFQFIKGTWKYGELLSAKRFEDILDVKVLGKGFIRSKEDFEKGKKAAVKAWQTVKESVKEKEYRLIILDELTYLINYGFIDEKDVIEFLANKPVKLHVVITGRDAPKAIVEIADLVTEMKEIKHPYNKGIKAQKGIEF